MLHGGRWYLHSFPAFTHPSESLRGAKGKLAMDRRTQLGSALALFAIVGMAPGALAEEKGEGPPRSGVYTSAIYESEAAMLGGEAGSKHVCVWKGREKKEGKVICKWNTQLKCGRKGWYKLGPC